MKIVYSSFYGRYSNHPRALYEGLRVELPDAEHIWFGDPAHAAGFPPEVVPVPFGGPECVAALESADLVIANTHLQLEWTKKPGATYLQTWHGTPLKTVHRDLLAVPDGHLAELDLDIARWDYLLTANPHSTERLGATFGFHGPIWEVGSPRNDLLVARDREQVRADVRARLGLDSDTVAVLYTPTWRDDLYYASSAPAELPVDLGAFASRLGGKHRLLARVHYFLTDQGARFDPDLVTDVSWHPDVHELYLAADVMVTDYSSTMFDFAVTGKPLLFYTYDLERYRDATRGLYLDFGAVAPGPLLSEWAEVLEALADLPAVRAANADRYAEFRRTFCALEDGRATARTVGALRTEGVLPKGGRSRQPE